MKFGQRILRDSSRIYPHDLLLLSFAGDAAGAAFEKVAQCHLKMESPHDAATAYQVSGQPHSAFYSVSSVHDRGCTPSCACLCS